MLRVKAVRNEVEKLLRAVPFHPFALELEGGRQVLVERPENIAFDKDSLDDAKFYIIWGRIDLTSTFGSVVSVIKTDRGGLAGAPPAGEEGR